ncbi:hypothetical protein ABZS86_36610, partial [Streptomyces sp. NPDC005355]
PHPRPGAAGASQRPRDHCPSGGRTETVPARAGQSKGDQDPGTWWPSRTAYRCTYARAWVQVKYYYGLSVDSAEKNSLSSVLNGC